MLRVMGFEWRLGAKGPGKSPWFKAGWAVEGQRWTVTPEEIALGAGLFLGGRGVCAHFEPACRKACERFDADVVLRAVEGINRLAFHP